MEILVSDKKYVDYIFLLAGKTFSSSFLIAWTETVIYLNKNKFTYKFAMAYSPIITVTRNTLIGNFPNKFGDNTFSIIPFSGEYTCKKVIFLDDDVYWKPEDLEILLNSDKEIISGIYLTADQKTVALIGEDGNRLTLNDFTDKTEPFEVFATGLGFFACTPTVLESMKFPWFDTPTQITEDNVGIVVSEDVYFCNKAKANGYKIYVDPNLKIGHEKKQILTFI
jgi:hypothetical protein